MWKHNHLGTLQKANYSWHIEEIMKLEIIGKFYDNQSLSIINRNLLVEMDKKGTDVFITPIDSFDPKYNLDKEVVRVIKKNPAQKYNQQEWRHMPVSEPEGAHARVVKRQQDKLINRAGMVSQRGTAGSLQPVVDD